MNPAESVLACHSVTESIYGAPPLRKQTRKPPFVTFSSSALLPTGEPTHKAPGGVVSTRHPGSCESNPCSKNTLLGASQENTQREQDLQALPTTRVWGVLPNEPGGSYSPDFKLLLANGEGASANDKTDRSKRFPQTGKMYKPRKDTHQLSN